MLDKYKNPEKENETSKEVAERLQKEFTSYKAKVDEVNASEVLDEMEKEVLAELEENDKHIRTLEYNVPADVEFEGKVIKRSEVASKIIYYINKQEVEWQYCLGLYQLVQMWRRIGDKITYGALDSTLRILGQSRSKGEQEWKDTCIINAFVQSMDDDYSKDLSVQYFLAKKHDAIMARRDLIAVKPEKPE